MENVFVRRYKPVVAIDLDDTLSFFLEKFCAVYNEKSGDSLTVAKITDWELTSFVLPEWKERLFSSEIIYSEGFFLDIEAKPDAVEILYKLCQEFDTYIVSSCSHRTMHDKAKWIMKTFPFFEIKNFISCHRKQLIRCDVMIDDGFHNLIGGDYGKILIDSPHNQKYYEESNGMIRVKSLSDAYPIVKAMCGY